VKTVNFIEAVNSGKRFRRSTFQIWYQVSSLTGSIAWDNGKIIEAFDKDFINSQFELEEKSITITESELDGVWARHISCHEGLTNNSYRESFKKALGF